jgi:hypothetical protein
LVETVFSRLGGLPGELGVVVEGLALDGWDQPELAVEAAVVVPVDVSARRRNALTPTCPVSVKMWRSG